jgi:hypothetical protein
MANAERVRSLRGFGFTERQARFLVLVLEHSGVCLPRQYRTFAGVAHGRQSHRFFEKLIAGGFATVAGREKTRKSGHVVDRRWGPPATR